MPRSQSEEVNRHLASQSTRAPVTAYIRKEQPNHTDKGSCADANSLDLDTAVSFLHQKS